MGSPGPFPTAILCIQLLHAAKALIHCQVWLLVAPQPGTRASIRNKDQAALVAGDLITLRKMHFPFMLFKRVKQSQLNFFDIHTPAPLCKST